jgi:Asp-tRNA(Asn)/Glu-tRNA(Gln) amidotransferase A subunit family amidase
MNPDYTPGGSSGGEATALYMKGSILGWGTDIGGSVRIPSHMMGLYGLRCSVCQWKAGYLILYNSIRDS